MTWEEKIFVKYHESIRAVIRNMVKNEDDTVDLTIEAFAKAFSSIDKYQKSTAFSTWLYRIAVNNAVEFIRKNRLETVSVENKKIYQNTSDTFVDDLLTDLFDPELIRKNSNKIGSIESITQKLSPMYQALYKFRFVENFSYQEISIKLNLEPERVREKLKIVRELLISILERNQDPNII